MPRERPPGKPGSLPDPKSDPRGPASRSGAEEAVLPEDAVELARVLGAWGVRGGIKVKPFSAQPEALLAARRWWLSPVPAAGGSTRAPGERPLCVLTIARARMQGEAVVASARELADRDAAQALAGARVFVPRDSFPPTGQDEFYWVDLIGMAVRNRSGQRLGTVTDLIETGPHCVLCVQPEAPGAREILIPFVEAYVDHVDRAARTIDVDWEADF